MASLSAGDGGLTPDLHLKMSKKIAQLTKVIFHLNTRNEDFQMEVAHVKRVHTHELQRVTADAAAKLRQLQDQVAAQTQSAARHEKQLQSNQQAHERELTTLHKEAKTQQQRFQQQVQALEKQVVIAEQAFEARVQELTRLAQEQSQQNAAHAASASSSALQAALDDLRTKHHEEVNELVTASNAKYNLMLADQLRLQDELREDLARLKAAGELKHRQLELDHAKSQAARDTEAQLALDAMKLQLVGRIETLLREAETVRAQESSVRQDKDALLNSQSELQRQVAHLELLVTKAQQETQSVRKDAGANAQNLQHMLTVSTDKIQVLAEELEELKRTMQSKDAALQQTRKELENAQAESVQGSMQWSERQALAQQQMQAKELQIAGFQAELERLNQLKAQQETASKAQIQALEDKLAAKEREIKDLQAKLAAMELQRTHSTTEKDKLAAEARKQSEAQAKQLADLTQRLKEQQEAHDKTMEILTKTHAAALETLKTTHATALQSLTNEMQTRLTQSETQAKAHSSAAMEQTVKELNTQHAAALSEHKTAFETMQIALKQQIADKDTQLKTLAAQRAQLQKELEALQEKQSALTEQLKKTQDQLSKLQTGLLNQEKAAQKQLKDKEDALLKQVKELASARDALSARLDREKEQWQQQQAQTLRQLAVEHERTLAAAKDAWEAQQQTLVSGETSRLREEYDAKLTQAAQKTALLVAALDQTRAEALATQRAMHETRCYELEELRSRFASTWQQMEADKKKLMAQTTESVQRMMVENAASLDELEQRLRAAAQAELQAARAQHERDVESKAAAHTKLVESYRQQHALAMKQLQEDLTSKQTRELLTLRTELLHKAREESAQKESEHTAKLQATTSRYETQLTALQTLKERLESELALKSSDYASSAAEVLRLRQALEDKTRELVERVTALERANREAIETLKQAAKLDMDRLLEENLAETRLLSDEFEETKRVMTDNAAQLTQTVRSWEERYARRESRPEDVNRIAELERLVADREALVRKTMDEMAYIKRELLNREEMYNKTFARTPNVGFMQVLKPQAPVPSSTGPATASQAKRKTKPSMAESDSHELHRRNSERSGSSSSNGVKKSLPPLNSNQLNV